MEKSFLCSFLSFCLTLSLSLFLSLSLSRSLPLFLTLFLFPSLSISSLFSLSAYVYFLIRCLFHLSPTLFPACAVLTFLPSKLWIRSSEARHSARWLTSWLLVLAIIPAVVACLLSIHNFFFSSKEGNYEETNRNRNRNRNKNDSYQRSLFGSTYGSCSSVRVTDTDGDEGLKMLDDSCLSDIENDNDIIYEIIF